MNQFLLFLFLISQQSLIQNENEGSLAQSSEKSFEKPTPLISPNLFETVKDQVAGIPEEESVSYYQILKQVQTIPEGDLKKQSQRFSLYRKNQLNAEAGSNKATSPFVDMFKNPEAYQGMAVQLTGHARKIIEYPAGKNEFGIERLYECWLYTEESQSNPAVIISTHIPDGIPIGEELTEPVEVITATGIFYRKYIYSAQDTMRMAPMILASKIQWEPVIPKEKKQLGQNGYILIIVFFFLVFLVLYRLGNTRTDRNLIAKDRVIDEPAHEDTSS